MVNLICFLKKPKLLLEKIGKKNERATAERQAAQRAAANERANIRR